MRKSLFGTVVSIVVLAGPAMAADLPVKAPVYKAPEIARFNWTGPYIGANAGYGWENTQTDYNYSSIPAPAPPGFQDIFGPGGPLNIGGGSAVSSALAQGFVPAQLGRKSAGFFNVGGQIGYNYQVDQFVMGVETDFSWFANGVKSTSFVAPPNGIITNNATSTAGVRWLGTLRARVGYAFDRTLVYATGGLAYGQTKASTNGSGFDGANTDLFAGSVSGVRTGYAVGGGIEHAFTNHLTAKVEYLYYDLGTANYAVPAANSIAVGEGLFIFARQKFDGSIVRLGLNYKY